jgi:hypothetical protein
MSYKIDKSHPYATGGLKLPVTRLNWELCFELNGDTWESIKPIRLSKKERKNCENDRLKSDLFFSKSFIVRPVSRSRFYYLSAFRRFPFVNENESLARVLYPPCVCVQGGRECHMPFSKLHRLSVYLYLHPVCNDFFFTKP